MSFHGPQRIFVCQCGSYLYIHKAGLASCFIECKSCTVDIIFNFSVHWWCCLHNFNNCWGSLHILWTQNLLGICKNLDHRNHHFQVKNPRNMGDYVQGSFPEQKNLIGVSQYLLSNTHHARKKLSPPHELYNDPTATWRSLEGTESSEKSSTVACKKEFSHQYIFFLKLLKKIVYIYMILHYPNCLTNRTNNKETIEDR